MSKINIIRTELDGNPGLYGPMSDQQVADELNAVDKSRNRTSMGRSEVYENIEASALNGLTEIQLSQLNLALSDNVDPFGNAQQVFVNVFGVGSATITALALARTETVSRGTIIGIPFAYAVNVNNARNI